MNVQAVVYPRTLSWDVRDQLNVSLFNESRADVILFPGWSFLDTNHVESFRNSITNTKTLGFIELKKVESGNLTNALFCVSDGELHFVSFQLFSTSGVINGNPTLGKMFLDQFRTSRVFRVRRKLLRVMQCGELNILRNEQARGNKVAFRFSDREMKNDFRELLAETSLILNPQHTPMGNQGKMSKRREFLSRNKRGYISTSNVLSMSSLGDIKSSHYAYFNGRELERNLIKESKHFKLYEYSFDFS